MKELLRPTPFLNFDHPRVKGFVKKHSSGNLSPREKAVRLFYAVRDGIRYNPYHIDLTVNGMSASTTLEKGFSWCVGKAVLLSAVCRAAGIPARLGLADVRNYQTPEAVAKVLRTNVFYWHGYSLLFLNGKWVKATPAFDLPLCEKNGIFPVEFDGEKDAVFRPFDRNGRRHMEYLNNRGTYDDLPLDMIYQTYLQEYKQDVLEILLSDDHPVKKRLRDLEK